MIQFVKELWARWQQIQEERARFYKEHSNCWE